MLERLVREKPDLLPKAKLNIPKDKRWNKAKLDAAVIQGIIQGETIDAIAKRLTKVSDMNYNTAVRNAATMTTSAQNGGRMDSYRRAQGMGIKLKHRWLATQDGHTRASHRHVDSEVVEVGEKFSNGLEYPGDPNGAPAEVYNCRCCDIAAFEDSEFNGAEGRFSRLPDDMSYDEWKNAKGGEPFFKAARNVNRDMNMHKEYTDLYKQHKEAFTQAVPKNFNDFQDLKYENTDDWKQMVSDARTARNLSRKNTLNFIDNSGGSGIIKTDERFEIVPDKINKFLLKKGTKHSKEFFDVGYLPTDYELLFDDIANGFDIKKAVDRRENKNGSADVSIFMDLGKTEKRTFRTVWRIKENGVEIKPRLITAHREDENNV